MPSLVDAELWGLFFSALVSSTLFPGGSEAVLAVLARGGHHPALLLGIATLGNTLGALSTYLLGRGLASSLRRALHPREQRAVAWLRRHGSPLLLLSWLPVVGDALCLAAGWLRLPALPITIYLAIGKATRYAVVLMLASW